ncbi:methanol dehydrogenase activator [Abditibacteriota bacterium]|nr:methanol dehydrogenase activator [Abditibacteriota bacterium]
MSETEQTNPWQTKSTRAVYENPWISIREDQVIRPNGSEGIYGVVSMRNKAVGVVPLHDDGTVTLVGQWRYTMDEYSWEIPEGGCPQGETPSESALRELREETGLVAASIEQLGGELHLSNSVTDERGYLFVARGLTQSEAAPEETEELHVRRVPLAEVVEMVVSGQINDALTVMAMLLLERKLRP